MKRVVTDSFFDGVVGTLRRDEPLARYTSMHVGGPADLFFEIDDPADLPLLLSRCATEALPWIVLGRGSNLIVRDGGLRGLVIRLGRGFAGLRVDGPHVVAGAAVRVSQLLAEVERAGIGGFDFLTEIPAEVGGLIAMNAGIPGCEMRDVVESIVVADAFGARTVEAWAIGFGYRRVGLPPSSVVVEATLRGWPREPAAIRSDIDSRRARRRATQPTDAPNSGSMFKNPPGDRAGRLIDAAGLKGTSRGAILVSTKHANFFVNKGGGSARDVLALVDLVRDRVKAQFGVNLEPEVHVIGEDE
ncbi:MAG: UDP-N-acetylmuramate dehydrogenase [Deltaproteobacteria bacterium]|nr:UDP-N-acetylmuramate dehydrogenase [Deltaproteobacteria bacterium]